MTPARMEVGRDFVYDEEMSKAKRHGAVPIPATDPLYLLYTSGTTGTPKVRVHSYRAILLTVVPVCFYP